MGSKQPATRSTKKPTKKSGKRGFGALEVLPSGRIRVRYTGPDGAFHVAPRFGCPEKNVGVFPFMI